MMTRLVALTIFVAACGGSHGKASAPAPALWKDMNAEQRLAYMEKVVMPRAKQVFVEFDAERYKDMDCKTCHGPGADDRSFEMPNPAIKPLPNSPEAFMALYAQDADVQRFTPFMSDKVEPMMGELLQMTVFDPKTDTGELSCSTCHQLVDDEGNVAPDPRRAAEHDHAEHDHADHADHD
jgi:hypothetical protein